MQESDLLNLIKNHFPDISLDKYQFIDTWRDNFVIIVDNEIVFRIPRKPQTIEYLEKEKKMLDIVSSHIPEVQIPIQTIINWDYPFISMPYLDWKIFSKSIFSKLSELQKNKIAKDIANFLLKLHSIHKEKFEKLWYKTWWTDWWRIQSQQETFQKLCWNILPKAILQNILNYIEDLWNYNYPNKVMTHWDIWGWNIFLNHQNNSVLWIIDFSDARIADPAIEFDCLRDFWQDFFEKVVSYYWWDQDLIVRSDFYRKRREMRILMHIVDKKLDWLNDQIEKVQNIFGSYERFN